MTTIFEYDFSNINSKLPAPSPSKLPVYRGFNLTNFFMYGNKRPFDEKDFELVSRWGFNFVRLPMDYRCWTKDGGIDEDALKMIDDAIGYAIKHDIHISLNFHRAPGYCVNLPKEPTDLFTDLETQTVFANLWKTFADRYVNIPSLHLSFNLLNEPPTIDHNIYIAVMKKAIDAIKKSSPDRLIIVDGTECGNKAVPELEGLGVAFGGRGYQPFPISHYKASWVSGSDDFTYPAWPLITTESGEQIVKDKGWLKEVCLQPILNLREKGIGTMIGEWGAYNQTPHNIVLSWMESSLQNFKESEIGWALWNLTGSFGVLDSGRPDVEYEQFEGHLLDRKMLELLKKY